MKYLSSSFSPKSDAKLYKLNILFIIIIFMIRKPFNVLTFIIIVLALILPAGACVDNQPTENGSISHPADSVSTPGVDNTDNQTIEKPDLVFSMKGVGIDIPAQDFTDMKEGGIEVLTTEWGMEEKVKKARAFLDKAYNAGLMVVMDAGFSYTAWGFSSDDWEDLPPGKEPEWQKDRVQEWVKEFKDHPAVFGWDICNEFGENLPTGAAAENTRWPETAITVDQLKQARADILEIDPDKPILIRMNHQSFEKRFGYIEHNFAPGIAEIVMLNLYSNYMENGRVVWSDAIKLVGQEDIDALNNIDPSTRVWIALAAFEDKGLFDRPSPENLLNDIEETYKLKDNSGVGFFCWGPTYPDSRFGKIWYLPESGPDLWKVIKFAIEDYQQTD
jgi:hypothetical protein